MLHISLFIFGVGNQTHGLEYDKRTVPTSYTLKPTRIILNRHFDSYMTCSDQSSFYLKTDTKMQNGKLINQLSENKQANKQNCFVTFASFYGVNNLLIADN